MPYFVNKYGCEVYLLSQIVHDTDTIVAWLPAFHLPFVHVKVDNQANFKWN